MFLLEFPEVTKFFNDYPYVKIVIDAVLALFLISLVIYFCIKFKKALYLTILGAIMVVIFLASEICNFELSKQIYGIALGSYVVIVVVLLAPELRKFMEYHKSETGRSELVKSSTQATKEAIVDAVFNMSAAKVGALITFELHNSLEQYAERAINLNSDISRELLEQIFIKDSPLHDGGVIIRGNKIICAAAYYTLSQDQTLDKTVGSRHRAALGLSEITDSLTIIVSEETGTVHIACAGLMNVMNSKNELLEYISIYLGN
jgi:diadenylate cyclase